MMMMGLHFMDEVPFHTVYIHGIVRDEKGQKMSKSKGNVVDPLELIDEFGADALRFTMAALATPGRDVKPSKSGIAGYRNFGTKLWNAARYCEHYECSIPEDGFDPAGCQLTLNKWITGGAAATAQTVADAVDGYKFDQAASAIYQFVWHTFCDWYLEFAKPVLQGDDEAAKQETRAATAWTLNTILRVLHPFMPHLTEELWAQFGDDALLMASAWPAGDVAPVDSAAAAEMDWVVRLISEVRAVRSEVNVPGGAKIPAILRDAGDDSKARLATHRDQILWLARLEDVTLDGDIPEGSVQLVLDEAALALPLADFVDLDQERARLKKEIDKLGSDMAQIDKKLANKNFTSKAPEEVVAEQHERRATAADAKEKLEAALERLSS
jgi:valyl-tRNA synthetase